MDWLGRQAVQTFLQTDDFVRHVVATVDNLGRAHASPRLWPVSPMPGRYGVQQAGDATVATAGNAERYAAFITFVEQLDSKRGVSLYVRNYPLFQRAYEELGYPKRYFNDRLVEVIDLLIATPVPAAAPGAADSPKSRARFRRRSLGCAMSSPIRNCRRCRRARRC